MVRMLIHMDWENNPEQEFDDSYIRKIFSNLQTKTKRINSKGNHQIHAPNENPWSIFESTEVKTAKINKDGK